MLKLLFIILSLILSCGSGSSSSSSSGFTSSALTFQTENSLSDEWYSWITDRQTSYSEAFNAGRGTRTIRVKVSYDREIVYDPAWASEDEHFAALKEMAEATFPGWEFTFSASDSEADVTAILGYTGTTSFADTSTNTIYLIWEGIFSHEFAHVLGVSHHYCGNDIDISCSETPPDEGGCIMGRNANTWGPTERFLLNLTSVADDDAVGQLVENINARYPSGYPNDQ